MRKNRIPKLIKMFGGRCVYCGTEVNRTQNHPHGASVDHIVPRNKGGLRLAENSVLACRNCNSKRGSMSLVKFLRMKTKAFMNKMKRNSA